MKATYQWLRDYVDFPWSPDELSHQLTMLGMEVESVQRLTGEFEGVVVAEVLSCEKHPNADRLSLCQVNDGQGKRQIVCGAKNFKVGDKVPLALPGASLPSAPGEPPFVIKVSKMRGVESQGMMCSARELQLAEDAEGLLILPAEAKVGQPLAEHLGRSGGDVVYDLEITPNRPDLNSVIGIAREISALSGQPLRLPAIPDHPSTAAPIQESLSLQNQAEDLCPRYLARLIRNVKVKPSPAWLKDRLEKVGLRSINNIVDVTNFVMLETGHPLHAFDLRLLDGTGTAGRPGIVVRRAQEGEKFKTLDGVNRSLKPEMLVIADTSKAIALAGVMGGQNSEIQEQTQDVLLESAVFQPQSIRRTAREVGLRTEASHRFERGTDWQTCAWASRRAAQLIAELADGEIAGGTLDAGPGEPAAKTISYRPERASALLGIEISRPLQIDYLQRLQIIPQTTPASTTEPLSFQVPAFRLDLKSEADLIEEITRLHGVDKIPSTPPRGALGSHPFDEYHDFLAEIRRLLTALGLDESQSQTLLDEPVAGGLVSDGGGGPENIAALVRLKNPLSSEMSILRPSLLPGLLATLGHNAEQQNHDVAIFEVGRVFTGHPTGTNEQWTAGLALTGIRHPAFWEASTGNTLFNIFDLKGLIEELMAHLNLGAKWEGGKQAGPFFMEEAGLFQGKVQLGRLGQLSPNLAKNFHLKHPVFLAEISLEILRSRAAATRNYQPLSTYPAIRRDVAMLLAETVSHEEVLNLSRQHRAGFLEAVELFDVFRGKNIPPGQKSAAYSFVYRAADRTLTDQEVNAAHQKIVLALKEKLSAQIRE